MVRVFMAVVRFIVCCIVTLACILLFVKCSHDVLKEIAARV